MTTNESRKGKERGVTAMMWNLWHGCHKISEGCLHCYVYRRDSKYEIDSSQVRKTKSFRLPVERKRNGTYKLPSGTLLWTCFTSDFFIEEADPWRSEAWAMIQARPDVRFVIVTKRANRIARCLPPDWGTGYANVTVYCTVESQRQAEFRLPVFRNLPIVHKGIICEPLLEDVHLRPWLGEGIEHVIVGGESGDDARPCHFDWVMHIRQDCLESGVPFTFKQTGAHFVKDNRLYRIARKDQMRQARKANINLNRPETDMADDFME